jgi:hypothetical protein
VGSFAEGSVRAAIAGDVAGSRFERSVRAGDSFEAARRTGYEGALRRAISVGGDSDTIACTAAAVAGAFRGIPAAVAPRVEPLLASEQPAVRRAFEAQFPESLRIAAA